MKGDQRRGYTRGYHVGFTGGTEYGRITCPVCAKRGREENDKRNIRIADKRNQALVGSFHHRNGIRELEVDIADSFNPWPIHN